MNRITSHMKLIQGYFRAQAFENDKCIYAFEDHNKVVAGAGQLITNLLGGFTQAWNPASANLGITKFVLFGIDNTLGTCSAQMLAGSFGIDYTNLDPILLTDIDIDSFPCLLASDNISVVTSPVRSCAELTTPVLDDLSVMSSDVDDNQIDICVRIGPGHVAVGLNKYYAMAALVGKSANPADANEYIIAMEQFPVMIKSSAITFRFLWSVYI